MNKKWILAALLATAGSQVFAQEATESATTTQEYGAISPKISTLGLGLEYKYPVTDNISASAGIYGASFSRDETTNDVKYDAKLKLRHLALLGNYYPWDNGFHIDGGLVLNGTKFEADAEAVLPKELDPYNLEEKEYTFNGHTYTIDDVPSVSAEADFRKIAPYLGIGYDNGNKGGAGWSVAASAGIMFSGSPDLSFDYTCKIPEIPSSVSSGSIYTCDDLKRDIEKERADLQDDLDKMKVYPVLSVGVMYKF